MRLLHHMNQAPGHPSALTALLPTLLAFRAEEGEQACLLVEDGVYHAHATHPQTAPCLQSLHEAGFTVYALKPDIIQRGLQNQVHPSIHLISYEDWVELCCHAAQTIHW